LGFLLAALQLFGGAPLLFGRPLLFHRAAGIVVALFALGPLLRFLLAVLQLIGGASLRIASALSFGGGAAFVEDATLLRRALGSLWRRPLGFGGATGCVVPLPRIALDPFGGILRGTARAIGVALVRGGFLLRAAPGQIGLPLHLGGGPRSIALLSLGLATRVSVGRLST
jgi:hypothetical protein